MYTGIPEGTVAMERRRPRSIRAVFTADTTHHRLPLNLSEWLPADNQVKEDTFVLVTLSVSDPTGLVTLDPSTIIINLRNNTFVSKVGDVPRPIDQLQSSQTVDVPVAVSTVFLPCPQPSNQVISPNHGSESSAISNYYPTILGIIFGCLTIIVITIIIPIVILIVLNKRRKSGFYDVQARSASV